MQITIGSLFDGIGGFPLAGLRNGMTTLWASEIEPFPIKVTKIRFPNMNHLGDITKINGSEIEPVDIITFGSPCQGLSVAGKRAGLADERSGLFMEAIRIIREMREHEQSIGRTNINIRPRFAVWENVPGAFSSNKGEDFRAVLEETARVADKTVVIPKPPKGKWTTSGAIMGNGWSIAWRVLDAQYWGVPQRRRRIFLVADFGGQSAPEILFKREGLRRHLTESRETREGIATDAERSVDETSDCLTPWGVQSRRIHKASGKWPALYGGEGGGHGYAAIPETPKTMLIRCGKEGGGKGALIQDDKSATYSFQRSDEFKETDKASTQSRRQYKDATDLVVSPTYALDRASFNQGKNAHSDMLVTPVYALDRASFNQGENAQYDFQISGDGKTQTITSRGPSAVAESPSYSVRRLTPLECERLQGFPDGWTDIPGQTETTQEELEFWREVWFTWDKVQSEKPEEVRPRRDKAILRWLKNPTSDSAQYKALGNSVAVCCPEYVLEGIKEVIERGQQA
jgi:DNA (cytosine-5)-methyltransferase 1